MAAHRTAQVVVGPIAAVVEEHRTGPEVDTVGSALEVARSLGEVLVDIVAAGRRALASINTGFFLTTKNGTVDLYTEA